MSEWIAIGLTALGGILSFYGMWVKLAGRMDNAEDHLAEIRGKHDKYHGQHFEHAADTEAHWTERERDSLEKKLDSMDKKLDRLLQNGDRE